LRRVDQVTEYLVTDICGSVIPLDQQQSPKQRQVLHSVIATFDQPEEGVLALVVVDRLVILEVERDVVRVLDDEVAYPTG